MQEVNRIAWMVIFLGGAAWLGWLGWRDGSGNTTGWFLFTSLWSAVCGIGYTLAHWFIGRR